MKSPQPPHGERELDLLNILWTLGRPASVSEVRRALENRGHRAAYTTVQTMLNRLTDKGAVRRDNSERAHVYSARLRQDTAVRAQLERVLRRFFDGSPESLAAHLVDEQLPAGALERLARLIEEKRRVLEGEDRD